MLTEEYIHETIGKIVVSLRDTAIITNIVVNVDGNFVVTAPNSFKKNDSLNISNDNNKEFIDLVVLSSTSTEFIISDNIAYDDQYNYTFYANAPYYMHEKRVKAHDMLTHKDTGSSEKYKKYPLFLLLRPYKEDNTKEDYVYSNLSIALVNSTKQSWNADQRYTNNITPNLEPLYDEFLNGIIESKNITLFGLEKIQHHREDECLIDGNPLPDTLDGIMIEFIDLPFKRKC